MLLVLTAPSEEQCLDNGEVLDQTVVIETKEVYGVTL